MRSENIFCVICLLAVMSFVRGIPDDFCRKTARERNSQCKNIYIWKSDQKDFISLLNVTLGEPGGSDLGALEGKTVRVIADNMKPYIISNNKSRGLSGYLGDVWNVVQEALRFKSNVTSVNYDSGLDIISKGDADVLLAAGVVKPGLTGIEYSQPYLYNWYHLYIQSPEARASPSSYIKTLNRELWLASSLMLSILTISLWLTIKLLNSTSQLEPRVSLPSCFLSVCSGFLNQGFDLRLASYAGRMLLFFSFIPGFVLYSAINAVLVAKLAVYTVELPFKSIHDVRVDRKLSLCLRNNSFVYNNFTVHIGSTRIVHPEWKGILNGRGCLDINHQQNLAAVLCTKGIVILENRVVLATVVKDFQIKCDISYLKERYFSMGNSFLFNTDFHGKESIEKFMKHLKSTGLLQKLERKWIRQEIGGRRTNQQMQTPQVTFNHISGLLSFYALMASLSLLILGIEVLASKYFIPKITRLLAYPFIK